MVTDARIQKIVSSIKEERNSFFLAIVFKGRRIFGIGTNSPKTHPSGSGPVSTIHAEIAAINAAKSNASERDISGMDIFIMRIKGDNTLGDSFPCSDCMNRIKQEGIKRIVYFKNSELRIHKV